MGSTETQACRRGGRDTIGPALAEIAAEAGRAILEIYDRKTVTVARKSDQSPVTDADRVAEEIILERLSRLAGDTPVLAEEQASAGIVPEVAERFFLVDPLDGTREFISGNGEFTVNIALIEASCPVAGVVYAPALGIMAVADGAGAREALLRNGDVAGANWRPLATRPVLPDAMIAVASRSHRDVETDAFLAAQGVAETRSAGSSLKFLLVARGEADVYPRFGRTMEWDTAAGHAVLAAAGGAVVTVDDTNLVYGKRARGYDNPGFIAWGRRPK